MNNFMINSKPFLCKFFAHKPSIKFIGKRSVSQVHVNQNPIKRTQTKESLILTDSNFYFRKIFLSEEEIESVNNGSNNLNTDWRKIKIAKK